MTIFGRWFAYGLGRSLGRFARSDEHEPRRAEGPVRVGTEEDFRRDEERFREDEKRIESSARKRER